MEDGSGIEKHHRERATLLPHIGGQCARSCPMAEFDRLTIYIALQMRKEGGLRDVITETIYSCVPKERPEPVERDWRRYAERMAACAFGMEGNLRREWEVWGGDSLHTRICSFLKSADSYDAAP